MNDTSTGFLFFVLVLLLFCSAYFAASETAMLSINRYRLRRLAKKHHRGAQRTSLLLDDPDKLLGVILIGSYLMHILTAALATVLALRLWGTAGVVIAMVLLTAVMLILAEIMPRSLALLHPERVAFPSSIILVRLQKVLHPAASLVNTISNGLATALGLPALAGKGRHLSKAELRNSKDESGSPPPHGREDMLLNVLDLDKVTVNDIMVPRNEVVGIDLEDDMDDIMQLIMNSQHTRLPVYRRDLNNVAGLLHLRGAARLLRMPEVNKAELLQLTTEAYFIPESTPLATQLINFQKQKRRIALVVDEYGDVKGIVTLEDILGEIVSNFTTNQSGESADIHPQEDGSYLIDASAYIREINRALHWHLATDGPKTLNGLLTEQLESIPENNVGIRLPGYCAEIMQVKDNMIKTVRMWALAPVPDDLAEFQANHYD